MIKYELNDFPNIQNKQVINIILIDYELSTSPRRYQQWMQNY